MGRPKETRIEILDLAENFLRDRGFNAFSYADISSALKIKNAAVHYHFPGKADLGVAVIQRARERLAHWSQDQTAGGKTPPEKLEAFFRRYLLFLKDGQQVCLGGALQTDFKTLPAMMQAETKKFAADILSWLEQVLVEGREKRLFAFPGKAKDQAILILAGLQGALQMTRAVGPSCLHLATDQIRRLTGMG
jgi:TetR/AcrR family transcriptional regulator, transcriptional repressor for nem operon